jgi:copper chaperone CopZ
MPNESSNPSGAEEFVTAEVDLSEPLGPEQEKNLRDALERIDGRAFESCDVTASQISVSYDPTRTKKQDLLRLIEEAGGKLKHVESEGSPLLGGAE